MNQRYGIKWTREETILAYDLYCKIPFSKISKTNKEIICLATAIGRTPSSLGLKMANLARFDSELQKKNISGMKNGSKLDEQIYNEFENNWTELAYEAQMIKASMLNTDIDIMLENIDNINDIPNGTYKERLVKTRVGQEFFRKSVLNSYNNRCCITGISNNDLLVASHIKPWRVSNEENERTNPTNGLCLNGLHDKAFDKGLITISRNYKVIISSSLKDTVMDDATAEWFFSYENNTIELPDKFLPNKEFIEYHNDAIFIR